MKYGICYQGSKSQIAEKIISQLPAGNRLVDIFGGGGAISCCAALSGKYKQVYYNDYEPLIADLFRRSINGDFAPDKFIPEWVSREEFLKRKATDGYIKYVWSFGCDGNTYLYSKKNEPWKKALHYAVVFRDYSLIDVYDSRLKDIIDADNWHERRLNCIKNGGMLLKIIPGAVRLCDLPYKYTPKCKPGNTVAPRKEIIRFLRLQSLECEEHLERLQRLQSLEMLQSLQQFERLQTLEKIQTLQRVSGVPLIEINCGSYLDYEYQPGDIVYCDIPYENTKDYGKEFNHKEFYDWAYSRPYQVFFSSYNNISDKRFPKIYCTDKNSLFAAGNKTRVKKETLYTNKTNMTETYKTVPCGQYLQYVMF